MLPFPCHIIHPDSQVHKPHFTAWTWIYHMTGQQKPTLESLWSAPIRMYTPALRISVHIYFRSVCLNHIWPWEYIVDTLSELVALFMDDMFLLSILLGWLSLKKANQYTVILFLCTIRTTDQCLATEEDSWVNRAC